MNRPRIKRILANLPLVTVSLGICLVIAEIVLSLLNTLLNELDIGFVDLLPEFRNRIRNCDIKLFRRIDRH